jgi:hypothetical protein
MSQHRLTTTRIDDNTTLIDDAWYQDDQPSLAQFAHMDQVYRIGLFRDWLGSTGGSWLTADVIRRCCSPIACVTACMSV